LTLQGTVSIGSAQATPGGVTVTGTVGPVAPDNSASVTVLARPAGSNGAFTQVGGGTLAFGQSAYAVTGSLQPGAWQIETAYQDPGQFQPATSPTTNVTVPAGAAGSSGATGVSFKKLNVKNGVLTLTGTLSRAATGSGTRVKLFALRTGTVKKSTHKAKDASVTASAAAAFHQVGKTVTVKNGSKTFTIKAKLQRGFAWVLQLEFVQSGSPSSFSKLRTLAVH
jgi:hypothetical protein